MVQPDTNEYSCGPSESNKYRGRKKRVDDVNTRFSNHKNRRLPNDTEYSRICCIWIR